MRIQLLHLDGPHRGRTITYGRLELLFGTAPEADVRYTEGVTVQPRHAEITFSEQDCTFYLKALEGEVFVNHNEVEEVVLEQNDLIEIGRLGPKLRFRVYAKEGRACKPFLFRTTTLVSTLALALTATSRSVDRRRTPRCRSREDACTGRGRGRCERSPSSR